MKIRESFINPVNTWCHVESYLAEMAINEQQLSLWSLLFNSQVTQLSNNLLTQPSHFPDTVHLN